MPGVITTCAKCGAQYSWNTDHQEYPDCPRCGYNAMKVDTAKLAACSSAAARGDLAAVKQALGDPDVRKNLNAGPLTILHHAVSGNQIHVVKYLLSEGANLDAAYPQAGNHTPLHIAASKGYRDIAKVLIDSGARVDARSSSGETPMNKAADDATRALLQPYANKMALIGDFFAAVKAGEVDKVQDFLKRGIDPNEKDPRIDNFGKVLGIPPLCYATGNQARGKQLAEMLLRHGADPNIRTNAGKSALHNAVTNGRADIAELLIDQGADVNVRDQPFYTGTPLHYACDSLIGPKEGRLELVKLLLEKGADVHARDKEGKTPIREAAVVIASQKPNNKPQCADDEFALLRVLLDSGATLDEDQLPVVWVTDKNAVPNPAIKAYLKSYAERNPTSPQADITKKAEASAFSRMCAQALPKAPALHKAVAEGNIKRVEKLLAGGWFSGPSDINERHDAGSPLLVAVYSGNQAMAELLLSRGANPNYRISDTGQSLEDFARLLGHREIADYLARTPPPQKVRTGHVASVSFSCPSCHAKLHAKPEQAGRRGKCPKCGQSAEVPSRTNG